VLEVSRSRLPRVRRPARAGRRGAARARDLSGRRALLV